MSTYLYQDKIFIKGNYSIDVYTEHYLFNIFNLTKQFLRLNYLINNSALFHLWKKMDRGKWMWQVECNVASTVWLIKTTNFKYFTTNSSSYLASSNLLYICSLSQNNYTYCIVFPFATWISTSPIYLPHSRLGPLRENGYKIVKEFTINIYSFIAFRFHVSILRKNETL